MGNESIKEVQISDLIKIIKDFWSYIWKKKGFVITMGLIGGALGLTLAIVIPTKYYAKHTLTLETAGSQAGGVNSVLSLANQFGFGGNVNVDEGKFCQIITSRRIVRKALFKEEVIDGKKELFINHWLESEGYFEEEDAIRFNPEDYSNRHYAKDSLVIEICKSFTDKNLTASLSEEGLIGVGLISKNEQFSQKFSKAVIDGVSEYYTSNIVQKERTTVKTLGKKVDSLLHEINQVETAMVQFQDNNRGVLKFSGNVETLRFQRDLELLNRIYAETLSRLEFAKYNLDIKEPLVQIIDQPLMPLERKELAKRWGLGFGGLIFGFLAVAFLILRKLYSDFVK